jgi:hypothetical protein
MLTGPDRDYADVTYGREGDQEKKESQTRI